MIVVIDGPDPDTRARLQQISDPRLRVHELPESRGGANARNVGVQLAGGDWVAFLDDDDEWMPEKLRKQIIKGERTRADIVASRLIFRSPRGDEVWPRRLYEPGQSAGDYLLNRRGLAMGETLLQTSTLLVRREHLLAQPFRALPRHQDWDWIIEAVDVRGRTLVVHPEPLAVWNVGAHESVSTSKNPEPSWNWLHARRKVLSRAAQSGFLVIQIAPLYGEKQPREVLAQIVRELVALRASPRRWVQLLAMWFVPQSRRQQLRAALRRSGTTSP
ncbi:hypothetical protein GCM10010842_32210 [Deinococcus daejeonensis]|uniref:Glycosyltransferase 2-like domain-containing protein n=1 Tax=Deinococcus daejeonensis TaxID=1007098 RepID=A0ABQ2JF84_9DEIO|nr:hypothetical protein GCM10010842_32210 [Deinococcus daejeonensis]